MPDRPVAVRLTVLVNDARPDLCSFECPCLHLRFCAAFRLELSVTIVRMNSHFVRCQPCLDAEKEARDG